VHKNKIHVLCLFAGLLVICFWGISQSQAQMLRGRMYKGDKVVVILDSKVSTKNLGVGDKVDAHVKRHVERGDDTYIYGDDPVWAKVKSLKKPGIYGKKAELVISFDSTKSTGGTTIPLTGEERLKGKGKGIIPYLLFPIGWLFKGSHIETTGTDTCVAHVNVPDHIDIDVKP
jgi:hypothetical protein